jgi:tetratricopeptide (TPR) repeat protein
MILRPLAAFLALGIVTSAASADNAPDKVLDEFVAAVQANKELPGDKVKQAVEIVAALRVDPDGKAVAITEGLRELYPEFRDALSLLGEENLDAAVTALGKFRDSSDPYLAAEASYYLARAYLLGERYEDALPLLEDAAGKWAGKTTRDGEAMFLRGVAYGQLLQRKEAMECLTRFLEQFPDAPERMRVGAFRQLEVLKLYEEGTLTDVQVRMDYSRRKLTLEDTGTTTRQQQDKIIEILAKLIKEAEERECNCKGGGKGSKPGEKQGQGGEGGSQGQGSQGGNSGGGSKGIDSDTVKRLHRGGPQSPWSHLRDRERDPVFNAIKEKYPARYQQLIEQYYKSFADESEG